MSGISLPVSRPVGRALIVGNPAFRAGPLESLQQIGFQCAELDDPYAAMAELCQRPLVYRALILSLNSLFREELGMVAAVKSHFPHIDIWLSDTDGRQAALAESLRLGADGLVAEDGLHRIAVNGGQVDIPVRRHHSANDTTAKAPVTHVPADHDLHGIDSTEASKTSDATSGNNPSPVDGPLDESTTRSLDTEPPLEPTLTEEMDSQREMSLGEPVLTAEELRALLQEQDLDEDNSH